MRVLHVLDELRPSGAEVCLRVAAPLWAAHGVQCEILSLGAALGPYAPVLEAAGYRVTHLPQDPFRRFLPAYLRLVRGYDVVHVHVERANFYNALAARAAGVGRIVLSVHNVFGFTGGLRLERRVQRALLRRAGVRFLSVSASVREAELANFANPTTQIDNWYDDVGVVPPTPAERAAARARLGLAEGELAVVTIGNCSPVKNHGAALRALDGTPATLLHVGLEEPGEPERKLAADLGITDRVRFLGRVDDVVGVLAAADVALMPSRWEGMSIAALECLAAGLPALFADVPGLRDFRALGVPVEWVAPEPASIAGGLGRVAALDLAERRRRGHAGAAIMRERFSARRGVAAYAELYS